jgi:hypothetical protein
MLCLPRFCIGNHSFLKITNPACRAGKTISRGRYTLVVPCSKYRVGIARWLSSPSTISTRPFASSSGAPAISTTNYASCASPQGNSTTPYAGSSGAQAITSSTSPQANSFQANLPLSFQGAWENTQAPNPSCLLSHYFWSTTTHHIQS